jgi:histidine ammonia-lyase
VSEERLVIWQSEELVEGLSDLSSVALAGDLIALALQTIGDLAEARIATIPPRAPPAEQAANENASGLAARAAAFAAENRERARSTTLDPAGVWRLLPMAGTTALVIAIEFLEATRAAERITISLPPGLEAVRQSVRNVARPISEPGPVAATNLASVGALVGSGALVSAAGIPLPSLVPPRAERPPPRLGGRAKRT